MNFVKGFRYELYCIARAASTNHCVVRSRPRGGGERGSLLGRLSWELYRAGGCIRALPCVLCAAAHGPPDRYSAMWTRTRRASGTVTAWSMPTRRRCTCGLRACSRPRLSDVRRSDAESI